MDKNKNEVVLQRIDDAIKHIDDKTCTLFFFVSDSKNIPNSNTLYIYQMAKTLQEMGYDVCMLYQLQGEISTREQERLRRLGKPIDTMKIFEGVGEWLGESYASIPHLNIANGNWRVAPSDFLFIPEVFSSLLKETYDKTIPCKRYVILQNFKYVTEFIPYGDQWMSYGVTDAITATDKQAELIQSVFPYVNTKTLNPFIQENMCKPLKEKKLIVNIATQRSSHIEHIIKTFYWKYPAMQFVTFRTLRNLPTETYAEFLKEGCITVWYDPETAFGYSALDAMRCGNIVIGKIPEIIPEWMYQQVTVTDEDGSTRTEDVIANNGIWFSEINEVPDILAKVIGSWMRDEIPQELYDGMEETNKKYTYTEWYKRLEQIMKEITTTRKNEFMSIKNTIENKMKKEEEK